MLGGVSGSSTAHMLASKREYGRAGIGNSVSTVVGFKRATYTTLKSDQIEKWGANASPEAESRKDALSPGYSLNNLNNAWKISSIKITADNIESIKAELAQEGWDGQKIEREISEGSYVTKVSNGGVQKHAIIDQDTRISMDARGEIQIENGKSLYKNGVLQGGNENSLLLRFSDADLEGGNGDLTLLNFSHSNGGKFAGTNGKFTMIGDYFGAEITGSTNENTFAGTFTASTVKGGDSINYFSGAFISSIAEGGANTDNFSGIFVDGSTVNGNDGNDSFYGKYTQSTLSGGAGFNSFGVAKGSKSEDLNDALAKHLNQFSNVEIDAGENSYMEGIFYSSTIELGEGKHQFKGVFDCSTVNNSNGKAEIEAIYAENSKFYGQSGETKLKLYTGELNDISLGEGANTIEMGKSIHGQHSTKFMGLIMDMEYVAWSEKNNSYGTLKENKVDATRGSTDLSINTGDEIIKSLYLAGQGSDADKNLSAIVIESAQKNTEAERDNLNKDSDKKELDTSQIIRDSVSAFSAYNKNKAVDVTLIEGVVPLSYNQSDKQRLVNEKVIPNFHSKGDQVVYNGFKKIV